MCSDDLRWSRTSSLGTYSGWKKSCTRNPPLDRWIYPIIYRVSSKHPSKVVQDFFHPQYQQYIMSKYGYRTGLASLTNGSTVSPSEEMKCNEIVLNSFCHLDLKRNMRGNRGTRGLQPCCTHIHVSHVHCRNN